jgi:DNA polymerase I-like protein with 3'-5' exonuclease and polymerase domains
MWKPPSELPDLRNAGLIAIDLETDDERLRAGYGSGWPVAQGYIVGFSTAWRDGDIVRAHYFPIRHPDSANFDPQQIKQWFRDHVASNVRFVTQNGGYDFGWLRCEFGIQMPPGDRLEEIGIAAAMTDENRWTYNLDDLCKAYRIPGKDESVLRDAIEKLFGIPPDKQTGKNSPQSFIAKLPAHLVGPYAEQDARATLALWERLSPILDSEGVRKAYRLDCALMPLAQEMRARGIRVDLDAAERNCAFLLRRRDMALAELSRELGQPTDIEDVRSPGWMGETFDRLGIEYPRTPTGKPSFKAGVDGWMKNDPLPVPQLVIKAREHDNAGNKFIGNFIIDHAVKGRIHAEINLYRSDNGGARSSRLSYSDPALQQLPSKHEEITRLVRECLIPEDGEYWASCDFSQQEFRLLVNAAADLGLPGALEAAARYQTDSTTDFHSYVAELTGLDRTIAKPVNYLRRGRPGRAPHDCRAHPRRPGRRPRPWREARQPRPGRGQQGRRCGSRRCPSPGLRGAAGPLLSGHCCGPDRAWHPRASRRRLERDDGHACREAARAREQFGIMLTPGLCLGPVHVRNP